MKLLTQIDFQSFFSVRLTDFIQHRTMLSVAYQKAHFENQLGCQTSISGSTVKLTRKLTTLTASTLNESVKKFVEEKARICKPDNIQVCDGSEAENQQLVDLMVKDGILEKLPKYENWYRFAFDF